MGSEWSGPEWGNRRWTEAGASPGSIGGLYRLAPSVCPPLRERPLVGVLRSLLEYARSRDYEGRDHRDGPNSAVRELVPVESPTLDGALNGAVETSPVEIRPLLGVRRRRTPAAGALFALAYLGAVHLEADGADVTDESDPETEAQSLANGVVEADLQRSEGFCVGPVDRFCPAEDRAGTPSIEATTLAVRALGAGKGLVADWPDRFESVARSAERFVVEDLNYRRVATGGVTDAAPDRDEPASTVDLARCGRLLLDLYALEGREGLRRRADELLTYVADQQLASGGWREDGKTPVAGYRIGATIGAFIRHREVTGDRQFGGTLADALAFYRDELFETTGAPRWSAVSRYPCDVRCGAQGVLTFAAAGAFDVAERILGWLLSNLYRDGRMYRRTARIRTDRTTLMEWGQAWTCYAVAEYLVRLSRLSLVPDDMPTN